MRLIVFALLLAAMAFAVLAVIFRSGVKQFGQQPSPPSPQTIRTTGQPTISNPAAPKKQRLQPWLRNTRRASAPAPPAPLVTGSDPAVAPSKASMRLDEARLQAWSDELRQREEALRLERAEHRRLVEERQQNEVEHIDWVDEHSALAEEQDVPDAEVHPGEAEETVDASRDDLREQRAMLEAEREHLEAQRAWLDERERWQRQFGYGTVVWVTDPNGWPGSAAPAPLPSRGRVAGRSSRAAPPIVRAAPPIARAAPPIARAAPPIARAAPPIVRAAPPIVRAAPPIVRAAPPMARGSAPITGVIPGASGTSNRRPPP